MSQPVCDITEFAWQHYARYLAEAAVDTPAGFDWRTEWYQAARNAYGNKVRPGGHGALTLPAWQRVPGLSCMGIVAPSRVILFEMAPAPESEKIIERRVADPEWRSEPVLHCFARPGWKVLPKAAFRGREAVKAKPGKPAQPAVDGVFWDWLFDPPNEPWFAFDMEKPYIRVDQMVLNPPGAAVTGANLASGVISACVSDLRNFAAVCDASHVDWAQLCGAVGFGGKPAKKRRDIDPDATRAASVVLRRGTLDLDVIKQFFQWRARRGH